MLKHDKQQIDNNKKKKENEFIHNIDLHHEKVDEANLCTIREK